MKRSLLAVRISRLARIILCVTVVRVIDLGLLARFAASMLNNRRGRGESHVTRLVVLAWSEQSSGKINVLAANAA